MNKPATRHVVSEKKTLHNAMNLLGDDMVISRFLRAYVAHSEHHGGSAATARKHVMSALEDAPFIKNKKGWERGLSTVIPAADDAIDILLRNPPEKSVTRARATHL